MWKMVFLQQETNIEGDCLKRAGGAWTVCRFKEKLSKKERVLFLRGGRYPSKHYGFSEHFIYFKKLERANYTGNSEYSTGHNICRSSETIY